MYRKIVRIGLFRMDSRPLSVRNAESWNKVHEFYCGLASGPRKWTVTPLKRLVEEIAQTEIATSFRAGQSMTTLIISMAEEHGLEPGEPFVAVDFLSEAWSEVGEFRMEYLDGYGGLSPERGILETRYCGEEDAVETLRTLLHRLLDDTRGRGASE